MFICFISFGLGFGKCDLESFLQNRCLTSHFHLVFVELIIPA